MHHEHHGRFGFLRLACITPQLRLADTTYNAEQILEALRSAADKGVQLAVLPELCITGYTCQDLFFQELLQRRALDALLELACKASPLPVAFVAGLPVAVEGRLFNCAAFVQGGTVRGLVPKTYLPTSNEFYEQRWFCPSWELRPRHLELGGRQTPMGTDLLFQAAGEPNLRVGLEICEDLWAVQPPSGALALAGATVICNPSASNELLGKVGYRRELVRQQSARCLAAYAYCGAGPWESSSDLVYSGHALIAESGSILAESRRFDFETGCVLADVDLQRLQHDRQATTAFGDAPAPADCRVVAFDLPHVENRGELLRPLAPRPFVPDDPQLRAASCEEIFSIQATGLARRILHTGCRRLVLGVSGGLDSTLALLVCIRALDIAGLDPQALTCVTMPGYGTSQRTRSNATLLAELFGARLREIPISEAVGRHFQDIGHDPGRQDVTFENSQARERTQVLMDIANQECGFVVGTGDLSETALGWCTYNGDHMSMYHVNVGVPKTLVKYVIDWCAEELYAGDVAEVLRDVMATPISPELLPDSDGSGAFQETEAAIGPYELHDFFLFHALRYGAPPKKVLYLARIAFAGVHGPDVVLRWLRVFYQRFFGQQFKRSAMPDGPKVGTVALSPRGDWRMPSDAAAALWLRELDAPDGPKDGPEDGTEGGPDAGGGPQ